MSGITDALNSRLRINGFSSGLDIDAMVQQLMKAESIKVDKVKQDRQLIEWKRDDYRNITNVLRAFRDEYFEVLKPETNFRSQSAFSSFTITPDPNGYVTATAGSGAAAGTHNITVYSTAVARQVKGMNFVDEVKASSRPTDYNLAGKQMSFTLDGVTKTIDLNNYADINAMKTDLQTALDNAFGTGRMNVGFDDHGTAADTSDDTLKFSALNGSTFTIADSTAYPASVLGFAASDNKSNSISLNSSLFSIKDNFVSNLNIDDTTKTQNVTFTINGEAVDVGKTYETATLNDVMNAVNASSAGVELRFDSLNKCFTMTSKTEGAAGKTDYTDNAQGLLKSMGLIDTDPATAPNITIVQGQDAVFDLDGVTGMHRSSNQFTVDGITYTLKELDESIGSVSAQIGVKANVDGLYDKIKGFVDKYNEVIDKIYGKVVEKRPRSGSSTGDYYLPLTDDQKKEMNEDDIKLWEEKAKTGLLRSDPALQNIVYSMREALYKAVDGTSLFEIGITTSKNYLDGGKLVIDETKLRKAIEEDPNKIANLFAKESDYSYTDSANRETRFEQEGIAQRFYDVIQDNIRTTRDSSGQKGILLEKAGIEGDVTEFDNLIYDELEKKDTLINKLVDELAEKEEWYYSKFTAMETALARMNSQSSWLTSQMGQNV